MNSFVNNVQIGNTPSIIYPEIPSLKLKIASLLNQNIQQPKKGEFFSSTIPPFTDISLIINIEKDPILEEVFAFSYKFSIFSGKPEINSWFRTWADYLDDKITLEELILHFMQFHPGIQDLDDFKKNMLPQILSDFSKKIILSSYKEIIFYRVSKNIMIIS